MTLPKHKRQTLVAKQTRWFNQPWLGAFLLALCAHVGFYWLPITMPTVKLQKPRIVRVVLKKFTPKPRPKPVVQRIKPKKMKPVARRRIKRRWRKRRIRKRQRRRKQAKRRTFRQQKRPMIRKVPAKPTIQPIARSVIPPIARSVHSRAKASVQNKPRSVPSPRLRRRTKPQQIDLRSYGISVYRSIQRQQRYPLMAYKMRIEGLVILKVLIKRNGELYRKPRIIRSSGHSLLDQEAIRMVLAALPLLRMPRGFSRSYATFHIPIKFNIE